MAGYIYIYIYIYIHIHICISVNITEHHNDFMCLARRQRALRFERRGPILPRKGAAVDRRQQACHLQSAASELQTLLF